MVIKKETKKIIQYLRDINDIPRASGDEAAICEYLLNLLQTETLNAGKMKKETSMLKYQLVVTAVMKQLFYRDIWIWFM